MVQILCTREVNHTPGGGGGGEGFVGGRGGEGGRVVRKMFARHLRTLRPIGREGAGGGLAFFKECWLHVTCMPGESYSWPLRFLLFHLSDVS